MSSSSAQVPQIRKGWGGHNVDEAELNQIVERDGKEYVELKPGESIVFFNSLIHGSGPNRVDSSRIALTLCLMDAKIVNLKTGRAYPQVYGAGELTQEAIKGLRAIPNHVYEPA